MVLTRASLIEWASSWVPDVPAGQRERFVDALAAELNDWKEPASKSVGCKHCPFTRLVHYEVDGVFLAPGCSGFEAIEPVKPEPGVETAWLIERQGGPAPQWWTGTAWSTDSLDALRFAREQDARTAALGIDTPRDATKIVVNEHQWGPWGP